MGNLYTTIMALGHFLLLICILTTMNISLYACSSRQQAVDAVVPEITANAADDNAPAPQGVDPELWARLTAELSRVLAEQRTAHRTSAAPQGKGSMVPDLGMYFEGADVHLCWSYRQQGDYDLNGIVNIGDLALVGMKYGKTSLQSDWQQAQLADGDVNGMISLADIAPIGMNFGGHIDGYELVNRDDDTQPWALFAEQAFTPGTPATGLYPGYDVTTDLTVVNKQFCVRPYILNGTGREYGPLGNIYATATSLRNCWSTSRGRNYRDGATGAQGPTDAVSTWSYPLAGCSEINLYIEPVMDSTGTIYLGTGGSMPGAGTSGSLYAITSEGKLRWCMPTVSGIASSVAVNERARIVVTDIDGLAYCFTPDGKQVWRRQLTGAGVVFSPLFESTGISYIVTQIYSNNVNVGSTLYKLNAEGGIVWSRDLGAACRTAPFYNADNDITVVNANNELYSYSADGVLAHKFNLPDPISSSLWTSAVASRGTALLYATSNDRARILAYNNTATDFVELNGTAKCAPIFTSGSAVVLGLKDTATGTLKLRCYAGAAQIWENSLMGDLMSNIAIDASDRMYFSVTTLIGTSCTGMVHCVLDDQTIAWTYSTGEGYVVLPTLARDNLLVYVHFGPEGSTLRAIKGT